MFIGQAVLGAFAELSEIEEDERQQEHIHHDENDYTEPYLIHRISSDDLRGEQYGKGIGHGAREAEATGYYADQKAGERIISYR